MQRRRWITITALILLPVLLLIGGIIGIVRVEVNPIILQDTVQRLTYEIVDEGDKKGAISLSWDKIQLEMPIEIPYKRWKFR
ncbi:MAG: hypothetical protein WD431_17880 [Cyclobacteriaceae bacterium]